MPPEAVEVDLLVSFTYPFLQLNSTDSQQHAVLEVVLEEVSTQPESLNSIDIVATRRFTILRCNK